MTDEIGTLFEAVAKPLREAGVFEEVTVSDGVLVCKAKHVESDAYYRAGAGEDGGRLWVGLYTPDRWLSESIEAHLMHVGDKLEELLEEELVDQGLDEAYRVEHFRDEQMQYVFRSSVPLPKDGGEEAVKLLSGTLLAYEAAFRPLGDMEPDEES